MPTEKPKRKASPGEYQPVFEDVAGRLREAPWFTDGWTATVGGSESMTWVRLNKLEWKSSGLEIHFESWIKKEQIAKQRVPVVMHVEGGHHLRRNGFNALFHSEVAERVQAWEGYVTNEAGMTRLAISIPLQQGALASALAPLPVSPGLRQWPRAGCRS